MHSKKHWTKETGRILKQVASIIGVTISELEDSFSQEISKNTGTNITKERIHKLFCGEQWPVYYMGYTESTEAILKIAETKLDKCDGVDNKKMHEVKRALFLAFADFDHLSYFYSDVSSPNTNDKIDSIVERIMDDLSKFQDKEFLYILNKYLEAFLDIDFLEIDILTLNIRLVSDCKVPISISNSLKIFDDPVLQQWLKLRNKNHKDALRKVQQPQFEKIRNNLRERLSKCGFKNLIPLTCFIEEFLLEKKDGIWSAVTKEDINKILVCKYIFGANKDYWLELKSQISENKRASALVVSDDIVCIDLAQSDGVIWMDVQLPDQQ